MTEKGLLGPWVRRFLLEHLIQERSLARNTQESYRDTLRLLIPFAAETGRKAVDRLFVTELSPEVVRAFLTSLEVVRHCGVGTRNQRLAAIHAFARFVGERSPEHIEWCSQIRAIPFKKSARVLIPYLEKAEMDAMLKAVDRTSSEGQRDYAVLLFLYNSGARANEAAQLTIAGCQVAAVASNEQGFVRIQGKGGKSRLCPLWPVTVRTLRPLILGRPAQDHVFLNRRKQPLTRYGIHALVRRYAEKAAFLAPSLRAKRVSPHTIRHTTATHLLRAGVDINTIRAWLGHVSLRTTNIYTEIDLEMKAKALARCELSGGPPPENWHQNPSLMDFLRKL